MWRRVNAEVDTGPPVLPDIFGSGFYAGASLEAGQMRSRFDSQPSGGTIWSGSVFLAADTFAGPLYVGVGMGEAGRWSFYVLLGAPYVGGKNAPATSISPVYLPLTNLPSSGMAAAAISSRSGLTRSSVRASLSENCARVAPVPTLILSASSSPVTLSVASASTTISACCGAPSAALAAAVTRKAIGMY
jgi:hypothetical protein